MEKVKAVLLAVLVVGYGACFCSCEEPKEEMGSVGFVGSQESEDSFFESLVIDETSEELEAVGGSGISTDVESDDLESSRYFNVVALGDSIARGYGLRKPETECFPRLLTDMIGERLGLKAGYLNYAVDGHKTSDLLNLLESGAVIGINEADLVVLCIGANNILTVFTDTMMSFFEKNDLKAFDFINGRLALTNELINESVGLDDDSESMESIESFFTELNALLVSEEFETKMRQGIMDLKTELPKVLNSVFDKNPEVSVALMTLYNPFEGFSFGIQYIDASLDLESLAAKWVEMLNVEIASVIENFTNTVLVDTYAPFDLTGDKLINAGFSSMPLKLSVDPHPNAEGHRFIAQLYFERIKQMY